VRFHGSLGIEENSKRKFRVYYGKDWTRIAFEGLQVGDFIRLDENILMLCMFQSLGVSIHQSSFSDSRPENPNQSLRYPFGKNSNPHFRIPKFFLVISKNLHRVYQPPTEYVI